MILNIFEILIDFWFGTISKIVSVFAKPILDFVFQNIIGVDNWITQVDTYLDSYVMPGVQFAKNVIINITGIPNQLFVFISYFLIAMFGLYMSCFIVKFTLNAWGLFRTGKSIISVNNNK